MSEPPVPADDRGMSPAVGVALLVAIVVILLALFGVLALGVTEDVPETAPRVAVVWENDNAGLVMKPQSVNQPVTLRINDVVVDTVEPRDVGGEILLPLAPGDEVEMVADDGSQRLLVQKRINRHEAGHFIAYYTFEAGAGTTVADRSPNSNDATVGGGDPTWVKDDEGTAMAFDGSGDYVKVDQLNTVDPRDVEEFTVAVKYRIHGDTGDIQQLVEHRNDSENFEWFVETEGSAPFYNMHYTLWPDGTQQPGVFTGQLDAGDTHVVVGTYDGETLRFYRDGQLVGTKAVQDEVEMGALYIGADAVGAASQHLDGRIYQLRLYYDAMDDDEVEVLTRVMDNEAE